MTAPPHVRCASPTFPAERFQHLASAGVLTVHEGHFLYPADADGMHLTRFFSVGPLAARPECVAWVAEDIRAWAAREQVRADALLAPAQEGVEPLARAVAETLGVRLALWRTLPTGRFGEPTGNPHRDFVHGRIAPGMRVVVFNGITQQGRCVGQRLQDFAKAYSGEVAGCAVFAKGTTGMVDDVERQWGAKFYATIQVDIPVHPPAQCPLCEKSGGPPPLIPWTALRRDTV